MVHRPSDSRLLNSLLSNEKEYHKHLLVLLDNYSQQSLGAFAAYASASPSHLARAVIAVAGSFASADDALRRYAISIESWQAELRSLKDLEEDVGSIIRDREILVTRLIKLSKHQKPTRDSFIGTLGSSLGDASQTSLNSFTAPAGSSSSKLTAAQSELQACEAHLAAKEKELDELRISAVRRGLKARCKAMVECGWIWGEKGKEGLRALEGIDSSAPNGTDVSPLKLHPDPDRQPGSDLSSVGPSQSASQINLPTSSFAVLTDKSTSTPPRATSPAPVPSRSTSPIPPMPSSSSVTLRIPPAHSISELTLPSTIDTFQRRISDVPEEVEQDSSDEDSRPVEVVENTRFAAANVKVGRRFSILPAHSRDTSGSNTTSSGTGTGTGSFSQPASSTVVASPDHFLSHTVPDRERKSSGKFFSSIAGLFRSGGSVSSGHSGADKWKTRTESNLRAARRNADSDSEDDAQTEPSGRRLFGRRASHDTPPPPSPATGQKLRKRSAREKEKEKEKKEKEKDQGWISDGAAVRGRDARKGSVKRRTSLPDASPSPAPRSAATSPHMRSSSAAPASSSRVLVPGSLTPSPSKSSAKTELRVQAIARSSSTNVSRQGSLRSAGSAPPVNRRSSGERTASLPPSQSSPATALGRSNSFAQHRRSRSATYTTPPSLPTHANAGYAGSSQMSLMAIVEGVTRTNRAAWERANAGLPPDSAGGTSTVSGLVSVRAPPSVTKYNVRGEGGSGISFESVRAPGSVFATTPSAPPPLPPPSSSSAATRPSSLPPPPRLPMPPTPPGTAPKIPLRSALRNQSPTPASLPKPIVIPSAPPRVVVVSSDTPTRNGANREDEGEESDSGSVGSFRTVREELTPTPPSPAPAFAASSSALVVPGKDESPVSASTISANGGGSARTASGVTSPTRRKSVRVSLQPTFSPTPPALDEDEDEVWERSGRPSQQGKQPKRGGAGAANGAHSRGRGNGADDDADDNVRGKNGRERDFWVDSSDEDEEYSTARRMLTRANKKRW